MLCLLITICRRQKRSAFTLVELAVVVTIISILAALAMPAFKLIKERTQVSALENDLRQYEQVFEIYELKNTKFPPTESTAGVIPVGMDGLISEAWVLPSPVGGVYRWVNDNASPDPKNHKTYIEIVGTVEQPIMIEASRLHKLDREMDDGNLSTGRIQIFGSNIIFYIRI